MQSGRAGPATHLPFAHGIAEGQGVDSHGTASPGESRAGPRAAAADTLGRLARGSIEMSGAASRVSAAGAPQVAQPGRLWGRPGGTGGRGVRRCGEDTRTEAAFFRGEGPVPAVRPIDCGGRNDTAGDSVVVATGLGRDRVPCDALGEVAPTVAQRQ